MKDYREDLEFVQGVQEVFAVLLYGRRRDIVALVALRMMCLAVLLHQDSAHCQLLIARYWLALRASLVSSPATVILQYGFM